MGSAKEFFSRMSENITFKNKGNIDIDLTIPKLIWGREDFTGTKSNLESLLEKKYEVDHYEEKIENEKSKLEKELQKSQSDNEFLYQSIKTDLKEEKITKKQEFKRKREEVQKNYELELAKRTKAKDDIIQNMIYKKETEIYQKLTSYRNLIIECTEVLNKFKIPYEICDGTDIDSRLMDMDFDKLSETLKELENAIINVIDDSLYVDKLYKKVRNMDQSQEKLVGGLAIVTSVIMPLIPVAGILSSAAASMVEGRKANEIAKMLLFKVSEVKEVAKLRYNDVKRDNTLDTSKLLEEKEEIKEALKNKLEEFLSKIDDEERDWETDFMEKESRDYKTLFDNKFKKEIEEIKDRYNSMIEGLTFQLKSSKEKYEKAEEEFKKLNKVNPIMNNDAEEVFESLNKEKKLIDKFLEYNLMKGLNYRLDSYSEEESNELKKQIDYDNKLHERLLSLESEIKELETKGITLESSRESFREKYDEESNFFILDTNKLHLGSLVLENKVSVLKQNQESFADNWNNGSVLFIYDDEEEEEKLCNYVKYLSLQILGSMHPEAVKVYILNQDMSAFFLNMVIDTTSFDKDGKPVDNGDYVENISDKEILNYKQFMNEYANKLISKEIGTDIEIARYIKRKRGTFSKTLPYYINIVHRTPIGDDIFLRNENSKNTGIINFCIIKNTFIRLKEKEGKKEFIIDQQAKDILSRTKNIVYCAKNTNEPIFNIVSKEGTYKQVTFHSLQVSEVNKINEFMRNRFIDFKSKKTFTLVNEFLNDIIPPEKIWTDSALKNIKLNLGYENGDKSKPSTLILDSQDSVHMLLCGTTGGGKSVSLDFIINVLKMRYSPKELKVYYYDFKKVGVETHSKPYKWSNAQLLSASSTAEYALSVLEELCNEMDEVFKYMKIGSDTSFVDFRRRAEELLKEAKEKGDLKRVKRIEKFLPVRQFIIFDEFQELFGINDKVSQIAEESIERLARLARAAGIHLLAISQDPGSLLPGPVLQLFKVRACTKATADVSEVVVGSKFCSLPENQYVGFLAGLQSLNEPDKVMQFVVPYAEPKFNPLYSKISNDLLKERDIRGYNAVIYSDDDELSYDAFDKLLVSSEKNGHLVLGEIVKYQKVKKPASIKLENDQKNNIVFISSNMEDKLDFYKTIVKSIQADENSTIFTMFSKAYLESYNVNELVIKDAVKTSYVINNETGERFNNQYKIGIDLEEPKQEGLFRRETEWVKYFDDSYYSKRPARYEMDKVQDLSLMGRVKMILRAWIDKQEKLKREGIPYQKKYIILIDPEKDNYIYSDSLFKNDDEFKILLSDANTVGIHLIALTSTYRSIVNADIFRWKIGKSPGREAEDGEDGFKKLEQSLTSAINADNNQQSFKFKMASKGGVQVYAWDDESKWEDEDFE